MVNLTAGTADPNLRQGQMQFGISLLGRCQRTAGENSQGISIPVTHQLSSQSGEVSAVRQLQVAVQIEEQQTLRRRGL